MKIVISIIVVMLSTFCYGQDGSNSFAKNIKENAYLQLSSSSAFHHDSQQPITTALEIGYKVLPKTYGFIRGGSTINIYDGLNGQSDYCTRSNEGGLGIYYDLIRAKGDLRGFLLGSAGPHVYAGTTFGSTDWKYTMYECGFSFSFERHSTIVATFGYRYYNAREAKNFKGPYVSLGFRL